LSVPQPIAIAGAGGFGREVLDLLDRDRFTPVGFIAPGAPDGVELPLPILGDDGLIPSLAARGIATCLCVAIGHPRRREAVFEIAKACGLALPPLVHRSAVIFATTSIGAGAIIFPQVVVTANCRIGEGVLINSGASLGHDADVGDYSNIGPGARLAGHLTLGRRVVVGIGACFRENVRLGDDAIIGAGSVVLRDVEAGATVFGVPAKARIVTDAATTPR